MARVVLQEEQATTLTAIVREPESDFPRLPLPSPATVLHLWPAVTTDPFCILRSLPLLRALIPHLPIFGGKRSMPRPQNPGAISWILEPSERTARDTSSRFLC